MRGFSGLNGLVSANGTTSSCCCPDANDVGKPEGKRAPPTISDVCDKNSRRFIVRNSFGKALIPCVSEYHISVSAPQTLPRDHWDSRKYWGLGSLCPECPFDFRRDRCIIRCALRKDLLHAAVETCAVLRGNVLRSQNDDGYSLPA